jgi:perosamine synthetase
MQNAAIHALQNEKFIFGESVTKFEKEFARYCNTDFAISVSSGTAALQLSLLAAGVKSKDEIITPANSFIATANSIIHAGSIPVFCDSNDSYLIEVDQIQSKIGKKTKGIMPVHLYGNPADMDEINSIAEKNNLFVIEDDAQAHGALYKGKKIGSLALAGCFSFYSTKNMTVCGDGGMVTTNDENIAKTVVSLRNHGRTSQDVHTMIGYTARLNTVNAAIGRVQLKYLDQWVQKRREIAQKYNDLLSDVEEIFLPPDDVDGKKPSYHLFVIKTPQRDALIEFLRKTGIICLIHYPTPIPIQPIYKKMFHYKEGDFPKSEEQSKQILDLPMFPELKDDEIRYISEKIHEFFNR